MSQIDARKGQFVTDSSPANAILGDRGNEPVGCRRISLGASAAPLDRPNKRGGFAEQSRPRRFLRHPCGDWVCFAEAFLCLGAACLAVRWVRFGRLSRGLGIPDQESTTIADPEYESRLQRVSWALDAAARRTPWRSTCLIRALAGRAMLRRRGIPSTLYLGVNPRPIGSGGLTAHAWLRSGTMLVVGGREKEGFTEVACFADPVPKPEELS